MFHSFILSHFLLGEHRTTLSGYATFFTPGGPVTENLILACFTAVLSPPTGLQYCAPSLPSHVLSSQTQDILTSFLRQGSSSSLFLKQGHLVGSPEDSPLLRGSLASSQSSVLQLAFFHFATWSSAPTPIAFLPSQLHLCEREGSVLNILFTVYFNTSFLSLLTPVLFLCRPHLSSALAYSCLPLI